MLWRRVRRCCSAGLPGRVVHTLHCALALELMPSTSNAASCSHVPYPVVCAGWTALAGMTSLVVVLLGVATWAVRFYTSPSREGYSAVKGAAAA